MPGLSSLFLFVHDGRRCGLLFNALFRSILRAILRSRLFFRCSLAFRDLIVITHLGADHHTLAHYGVDRDLVEEFHDQKFSLIGHHHLAVIVDHRVAFLDVEGVGGALSLCVKGVPQDLGIGVGPYHVQDTVPALSDHHIEVSYLAVALGLGSAVEAILLQLLEPDALLAVVGQNGAAFHDHQHPVIIRKFGEVGLLQLHRGGTQPPDKVSVYIFCAGREYGKFLGLAAHPLGDREIFFFSKFVSHRSSNFPDFFNGLYIMTPKTPQHTTSPMPTVNIR